MKRRNPNSPCRPGELRLAAMLVALVITATLLGGQNPAAQADLSQGKKLFGENCSGCHGADALGTDRAPALAGNRTLTNRSVRRLHELIKQGIPGTGMPAFNLPDPDLDALAEFVHSLNWRASATSVPGDVAAGEQFFFGQGKCGSCHMVASKGSPVGPDLSDLGNQMTVQELREKLLHPDAHLTPGYELVTVTLRNGKRVHGFARNRNNYDIRVEDLQGQFHLLEENQIASIHEEKTSAMPAVQASAEEMQNLLAYLSRQAGVKTGALAVASPRAAGDVDFARILHPQPGDWITYNGNLNANRFSDLRQINTANVSRLQPQWIFTVPLWRNLVPDTAYYVQNYETFGLETNPLVADGIMYLTGPGSVFALDALSGRLIWEYRRTRTRAVVGDASLGTNRGVALLGDKVFCVTDNAHLLALNRITGKVVWEQQMWDEPQHYGGTVAPLIVKDMVVAGVAGGDWGIRGFIAAYKAETGERAWRTWTIPADGEPGRETWGPKEPKLGGGGTWLTGSYDPETDTLYWPTGNPWPDSDDRDRPGDNLYTDCILALDPATGKTKWYYQFTPHDVKDQDANQPPVLVDTRYQGQDRKLMLFGGRNGFFYVLDRTNGKVLLAKPLVKWLTWASGIGPDGRPQLVKEGDVTCPDLPTNWNAVAFNMKTRLFYVMVREKCVENITNRKKEPLHLEPQKKYLRALDIDTGKIVWEMPQAGPPEEKREAGVLATAGGLLFYGDPSGDFVAVDQQTGKPVWHFPAGAESKTSPMTYMAGGKQFVAIAIGPNVLSFSLPREAAK